MINKSLFSSKTWEWQTPRDLYDKLNAEFHFMCDPCTTPDNPLRAKHFFTERDDGLKQFWYDHSFVNPPYGRKIADWVRRAYLHNIRLNFEVVMLLPARTDTRWFHDYIYNKPRVEIRFLKGRLKFNNPKYPKPYPAPFPSMVVIFHKS